MTQATNLTYDRVRRRAKLWAKRLVGKELRLRLDNVDFPLQEFGDWAFCPALVGAGSIVYSGGVGNDIGLDVLLIQDHGARVFAFDPTPSVKVWVEGLELPEGLSFFPIGLAGRDGSITLYPRVRRNGELSDTMYTLVAEDASRAFGVEVQVKNLPGIMAMLGHTSIDMLKIDVEGSEYDVLDNLLTTEHRPAQLLVEFHHRFADIGQHRTQDMINRLRGAGYRLAFVSLNGREMTLVHGDARPFS
ncbi:MAG: FkbM family methyltransferase [Gammaproteobacteria bacterium]|nr:FkbM family methyltransferase [Gammaproteobacteria bacterium]